MQEETYLEEENQISVVIFEVNREEFAIDLLEVKEIIQAGQIRKLPQSLDFVDGIYNYRGDIIHIINLNKKLKIIDHRLYKKHQKEKNVDEEDTEAELKEEGKNLIIISYLNEDLIGFYVDKIINITSVDYNKIMGLSPIIQTSLSLKYIRGVIKFDEKPRILINLENILSDDEKTKIQEDYTSLNKIL
ncbi:MAG: chemotaxis protein CheW [Promethearchaeota archaeon]